MPAPGSSCPWRSPPPLHDSSAPGPGRRNDPVPPLPTCAGVHLRSYARAVYCDGGTPRSVPWYDAESARKRDRGRYEPTPAVRAPVPGLGGRLRCRRDRAGAGRGLRLRSALRAAAQPGVVGVRPAQRSRRDPARGRARLRSAQPGPAAGRPHDRLRAAHGGPLRRPPGRAAGLAGRPHGHGRPRRPAEPHERLRRAVARRRGAVDARGGHDRRGGRPLHGGPPGGPVRAAQRDPRRRGRCLVRHGLGLHQVRGRGMDLRRPARRVDGAARALGTRRDRAAPLAGLVPGRGARRPARHGHRGEPGGRGGRGSHALRRELPLRHGGHRRRAGLRRGRGGRPGPAHPRPHDGPAGGPVGVRSGGVGGIGVVGAIGVVTAIGVVAAVGVVVGGAVRWRRPAP
ncbi:hypothetical protein BN2537_2383 [Streptomyces venezuelae]|nr:hypothetical protein BN2537_2383 [Streptomyces venezuelae]